MQVDLLLKIADRLNVVSRKKKKIFQQQAVAATRVFSRFIEVNMRTNKKNDAKLT